MGITFYNNWRQHSEFQIIDFSINYNDECLVFTAGIIGFGFVIAWSFNARRP